MTQRATKKTDTKTKTKKRPEIKESTEGTVFVMKEVPAEPLVEADE